MALNSRRFLHIGLMKSGSTSFQTSLSQLSSENVIGYSGIRPENIRIGILPKMKPTFLSGC